eukprot:17027-Prorocentrum_minimum.AAC.1
MSVSCTGLDGPTATPLCVVAQCALNRALTTTHNYRGRHTQSFRCPLRHHMRPDPEIGGQGTPTGGTMKQHPTVAERAGAPAARANGPH